MSDANLPIKTPGHAATVELLAEVLCLNFVNTIEPRVHARHSGRPREYLTGYEELVAWSRHAEVITEDEAQKLLSEAESHPELAQAALAEAVNVREIIYHIFLAIAKGRKVANKDLDELSTAYALAMQHVRLAPVGEGFSTLWAENPTILTRPLWPTVQSAVELLLHGEKQRIKDCQSGEEGCGWLFYDTSKNMSRRWCSMRGCGAEAKERRRGKRLRTIPKQYPKH